MKKSIKEEKSSKQSIISRLCELQLSYNILFMRLNSVINQTVRYSQKKNKVNKLNK